MLTIASLFGKSPFAPLQTHIDKVACCVGELPALFLAILSQDLPAIEKIGKLISQHEHEADLAQNDISTHLPRSLFLPVNHNAFLSILSVQHSLAHQALQIAESASLRNVLFLDEMQTQFDALCNKTMEAFWLVRKVIKELDNLLESSFGGIEAQKVKGMIDQIALCERESQESKKRLLRALYQKTDAISYPVFHLSLTLIEEIGTLASLSERLGSKVRQLLELR